jgi:membrane protein
VKFRKIIKFLTEDLWRVRLKDASSRKYLGFKWLRVLVLSIRGFSEDKCMLRASALTFYSLLSIVPVLAMVFGIAKGFIDEKEINLKELILSQFEGQEKAIGTAIDFANNLLTQTKGGLVAGIGVIILFWTIIKVLSNIERSFNDIWGIKRQRSLVRKFSDYLSFIMVFPILFIFSSSLTIAGTGQVQMLMIKYGAYDFLVGPVQVLIRLLPFAILPLMFAVFYLFLPNGKVNIRSALLGGLMAGILYHVVNKSYVASQIGLSKYNEIYGSFAALPLFMIWLQLSWLIMLYGAEISFAHQNADTYEYEGDCSKASLVFKRLATLAVLQVCVKAFHNEEPSSSADELAHKLCTPIKMVHAALFDLVEAGILTEVSQDRKELIVYQPAIAIENLSVHEVLRRLDCHGIDSVPMIQSDAVKKLSACLEKMRNDPTDSTKYVLLKDI